MISKLVFCISLLGFFSISIADAQVCDDLIVDGCETAIQGGWIKIRPCRSGGVDIQYCHPRLYIGSGHNLTVKGSLHGQIVFDELLEKTTLSSGRKVRKAVGKNDRGQPFTGIFTYDDEGHVSNCYIKSGADRSSRIVLPE